MNHVLVSQAFTCSARGERRTSLAGVDRCVPLVLLSTAHTGRQDGVRQQTLTVYMMVGCGCWVAHAAPPRNQLLRKQVRVSDQPPLLRIMTVGILVSISCLAGIPSYVASCSWLVLSRRPYVSLCRSSSSCIAPQPLPSSSDTGEFLAKA